MIFLRTNFYNFYKRASPFPERIIPYDGIELSRFMKQLLAYRIERESIKFRVTVSPRTTVSSRADDVQSMHVAARPFDQGRSSFTSHLPRGILMDLPYLLAFAYNLSQTYLRGFQSSIVSASVLRKLH